MVGKNPPVSAGDTVWSLVWEDPTYHGANKFVCHNCWAHMLWLLKPHAPKACALQQEKPTSEQLEKARKQQWKAQSNHEWVKVSKYMLKSQTIFHPPNRLIYLLTVRGIKITMFKEALVLNLNSVTLILFSIKRIIIVQSHNMEKEMATHFSIFCLENTMDRGAWQVILWHDWATKQ